MASSSSSSNLWKSFFGRVHWAASIISSSSYGTIFHGVRFLSTGPSPKLFVGGLSWSTDEKALTDAFSSYGHVCEAIVVLDRETGRSRGFGYVSFMSVEDAESAKGAMDGNDMNGRTLRVEFSIEKPPSALPVGVGGGGSFGGGGTGFGGARSGASCADLTSISFSSKGPFESGRTFGSDTFGSKDGSASNSPDNNGFDTDEESFGIDSSDDCNGGQHRYDGRH